MSPEQADGKPGRPPLRSFSLGAILYEMATGRRAFQRSTAIETLRRSCATSPRRSLRPGRRPRASALDHRALSRQGAGAALRFDAGSRPRSRAPARTSGGDVGARGGAARGAAAALAAGALVLAAVAAAGFLLSRGRIAPGRWPLPDHRSPSCRFRTSAAPGRRVFLGRHDGVADHGPGPRAGAPRDCAPQRLPVQEPHGRHPECRESPRSALRAGG